ncbi:MAG: ABC transporter ATP-binding protein [Alphaproteobacteria bacterium]|nr:ABC transporter ATP-binding protein [Alphaproteobacteria bacterium]
MTGAQPTPAGQASALEMKEVRKSFGPTEIIRGLNLEVREGERHAIIGPNGAGKSTLFNLISGRYEVSSGTIALRGREITNLTPHAINRMGLARSFQVVNVFPMMTVFENVRCGLLWSDGEKYSFWRAINKRHAITEKVEDLLERTGLLTKRDFPATMLPYADQRALELAITLACGAGVLLLDEPTAGMSHSETEQAVALIKKVTEGKTLIMVEHDMGVVFDIADRISVLVYGEIIATDTPAKIRKNKTVQEAYLGDAS